MKIDGPGFIATQHGIENAKQKSNYRRAEYQVTRQNAKYENWATTNGWPTRLKSTISHSKWMGFLTWSENSLAPAIRNSAMPIGCRRHALRSLAAVHRDLHFSTRSAAKRRWDRCVSWAAGPVAVLVFVRRGSLFAFGLYLVHLCSFHLRLFRVSSPAPLLPIRPSFFGVPYAVSSPYVISSSSCRHLPPSSCPTRPISWRGTRWNPRARDVTVAQ